MHIYRKIRSIFDKIRPVVSHLDVWLHEKTMVSKNIGESLKPPQSQLRKEALFVRYYKNNNDNLLSSYTPIK